MKALSSTTRQQIILGIISGMRANAGPLCAAVIANRQPGVYFSPSRLVKLFGNKKTVTALMVSGAGELVMDKLPTTPDRIEAGGLAGRIVSGAVSAAVLDRMQGRKPYVGALIGGLAALASSFAFYYLRQNLGKVTRIPDPYIGGLEDALAIGLAATILKDKPVVI